MDNCFVSGETLILMSDGSVQPISELYRQNAMVEIYFSDERNNIRTAECISFDKKAFDGEQIYNILLSNGMSLKCSEDTTIVTPMGFGVKAKELRETDALMAYGKTRATIVKIEKDDKPRELYTIRSTPSKNFIAINRNSVRNESTELQGILIGQ
jgi:hypothetical protein